MKLTPVVLALAAALLVAGLVGGAAQAQDVGVPIELRLTAAVEGTDPNPDRTEFTFVSPALGGEVFIKTGSSIFLDVAPDLTFSFTQVELPGWEFVSADCTGTTDVTVDGLVLTGTAQGLDVNCTFTNRAINPDPVNLTITKEVVGTDPEPEGTSFEFTNTATDATSILRDGESCSVSYSPPRISVTERPLVGWAITSFECEGATEVVRSELLQVNTVIAAPGSEVSCTYVNEPVDTALLTVSKVVDGTNPDNASFAFSLNEGLTDFTLQDGGAAQIRLNPGTYTIAEASLTGWQLPEITCGEQETEQASEITLDLAAGPTTCTFVNRPLPTDLIGDVTCDGAVNILDAFATAQFVVNLRTAANGCPLSQPGAEINIDAVSIDGAPVTILDAFKIAQCVVNLSNSFCPEAAE